MWLRTEHRFPVIPTAEAAREALWALLWERVVAPERWLDGVTAVRIDAIAPERCRLTRRVWWGAQAFDEVVRWETGAWLQVVTHGNGVFRGSAMTITLVAEAADWWLHFAYRRHIPEQERELPDGSEMGEWLAAAYRAADKAYVTALGAALRQRNGS